MKVKFIKIIREAKIFIPHVTNEEYANNKLIIFRSKSCVYSQAGTLFTK